jgi:hypothetical protein
MTQTSLSEFTTDQFLSYITNIDSKISFDILLQNINLYSTICKTEITDQNKLFDLINNNEILTNENKKEIYLILQKNNIKYNFYEQLKNILKDDKNDNSISFLCFINKNESLSNQKKLFKILENNKFISIDKKRQFIKTFIESGLLYDPCLVFAEYIKNSQYWFINNFEQNIDWFVSICGEKIKQPKNLNMLYSAIENNYTVNLNNKIKMKNYLKKLNINFNIYDEMLLSILNTKYENGIPCNIVQLYYNLITMNNANPTLISNSGETIYHIIAQKSHIGSTDINLIMLFSTLNIDIHLKNNNNDSAYDILLMTANDQNHNFDFINIIKSKLDQNNQNNKIIEVIAQPLKYDIIKLLNTLGIAILIINFVLGFMGI